MTYTYTWTEPEQLNLQREDEQGNIVWIPCSSANTDYQEYLEWLAEDNEPLSADYITKKSSDV